MASISDNISISFIVPVLNGEKYILSCLDHISREMAPGDEIIVVDNGSTDKTIQIARAYPGVQLLQHPLVSISALRNRGAEQAKGDLFAFIDSDCLVCPGWRKAAVDVLTDERIAATGSQLDLPEQPSWVEAAWRSTRRASASSVRYIPSGNFVIRSSVFQAISGFDEEMITDEDTDIGTRVIQAGLVIVDEPQVRAIHLANPKTLSQFVRKEKWHSTSILQKVTWKSVDRPLVMTLVFLFLAGSSVAVMPNVILGRIGPSAPVALVLIIPLITALYRTCQFGHLEYFPQRTLLYLLFYLVRSLTIVEVLLMRKQRPPTS